MKIEFLDKLKPGQTGMIYQLPAGRRAQQRLKEMGLRAGMTISVRHRIPLRGPVIIMVGQTQIALGHGMAGKIKIKLK